MNSNENLIQYITESVLEQLFEGGKKKKKKDSKKSKKKKEGDKKENDSKGNQTLQKRCDKICKDPTVNNAALFRKAFHTEISQAKNKESIRTELAHKASHTLDDNGKPRHFSGKEMKAIIRAYNRTRKKV